jgi:hypothetical protein
VNKQDNSGKTIIQLIMYRCINIASLRYQPDIDICEFMLKMMSYLLKCDDLDIKSNNNNLDGKTKFGLFLNMQFLNCCLCF